MIAHINISIFGQVQGVNFRTSAKQHADALALAGFVRNEEDDSVYVEIEGQPENVEQFLEWCKSGNEWSQVERVEAAEGEVKNFHGFTVVR